MTAFQSIDISKYKNIHSCIVANSNEVLYEQYFEGEDGKYGFRKFKRDDLHELRSATKSIVSVAIGICLDQGLIESVNSPIVQYFDEYNGLFSEEWNQITVENLLTMMSGIKWNQSGTRSKDDVDSEIEMEKSDSPIRFVLSQPIVEAPNTKFVYNSGNTVLLGKIVEKASGKSFERFANEYLFIPLGVEKYKWWPSVDETYWTHAGLLLRSIDMCKIGQLLLNKGKIGSNRILSESYIEEMSSKREVNPGYGYQFWRKTFDVNDHGFHSYYAAGNGGQYIFVFPFDDLTVVFTGGNYHSELQDQPFDILYALLSSNQLN